MRVKVKDFNCIQDLDLEFHPGFTIIQGPSNSGKSSSVKAIENCIFNQSGTNNIRQGQDHYSVGIAHNDHTVSLIKGKSTKYKIDDQIYEKPGVSQLQEVADVLNIRETVLGGEKVRLNFSKQMSYPFLLDKTPGQLYKFIVDSSESESLSNVLKDISKDIKDNEKAIIQNDAQMDILIKQQTQLNLGLIHADTILDVSSKILELDSVDNQIEKMVQLNGDYKISTQEIFNLTQKVNRLNVDLNTSELDNLKEQYLNTQSIINKYKNIEETKKSLEVKVGKLTLDIDISELDKMKDDFNSLKGLVKRYHESQENISNTQNTITSLDEEIKQSKEKLSQFKVCPLCGNSIHD